MTEKELDNLYFKYLYGEKEVSEQVKGAYRKTYDYKRFMLEAGISELKENVKNIFRGKNKND